MTTLVTGAAGFVGSHVVEHLLSRGEAVRALVYNPNKVAGLRERGVDTIAGDVRDDSAMEAAVRGADVICHCAAAVGPHFSRQEIYSTNRDGVRNLLEAVRRTRAGRVVLLSSVNVLGTRDLDPANETLPCRRSHDPAADVKIEAERLALDWHRRHGTDVTILRPGFIYGPGDPHNLPRLISAIERGKFSYIRSRENVVPIVHVSDVVQAIILAATAASASGQIYHVTDGSRTAIAQVVERLAELLHCPPPQRVIPYFVASLACTLFEWAGTVGLRRGPAPVTRAALRFLGTSRFVDIRKAREELGYTPRIGFHEGLADTVRQLKESSRGQYSTAAVNV